MSASVQYELTESVAVIRLDDGKANALGSDVVASLSSCLDRAKDEAKAIVIHGREGKFSAGYNLKEMMAGPASARSLVKAGGELMVKAFLHELPIVAASTGHALAAGAILLLSCDLRLQADGPFKVGLNEVQLAMTPPVYLMELARHRLSKRWYTRAVTQAQIFDPAGALDAGFVDDVCPADDLFATAMAHAKRLGELNRTAFAASKLREREAIGQGILDGLEADMKTFDVAQ